MSNEYSLQEIDRAWRSHPAGSARAAGGRRALSGFSFQIAVSINEFMDRIDCGSPGGVSFDSLSDLTLTTGELVYVHQVKATLTKRSAIATARESIAVDIFLEEQFPRVQENVRYQAFCRRGKGNWDPRKLEEADLPEGERTRWQQVRSRTLEPQVTDDPYARLVARLFPVYEAPFELANSMLGSVLKALGGDRASEAIAAELLGLLTEARKFKPAPPPGRLLGHDDFLSTKGDNRILLGQRPSVNHLSNGYFMERGDRVEEIVAAVYAALDGQGEALPVHWIIGTSGAGKSVLLLQTLQRLVADGRVAVHLTSHLPTDLDLALSYWRSEPTPVVIAIDDLYAPAYRDSQVWESLMSHGLDSELVSRCLVLTAGPDEYNEAFTQLAQREEAFQVSATAVPDLDETEKSVYGRWYARRTGSELPAVSDPVFVVAAFKAEIDRTGGGTVSQFAQRFIARAQALQAAEPLLAALALNRLGIAAPTALFAQGREELDRLVAEGVAQVTREESAEQVTIYHQRLAKEVYEALVTPQRLDEQARHLTQGFEAMLSTPSRASSFLFNVRHAGLPRELCKRLFERLWEVIWVEEPGKRRIELIVPWVFQALAVGVQLSQGRHAEALAEWIFAEGTPSAAAPAIWRALKFHAPEHLEALDGAAEVWLGANSDDPAWPELFRTVTYKSTPAKERLDWGEQWLKANPQHEAWVDVFLALLPHRPGCERLAVTALERAPVSKDDPKLWRAARRHASPSYVQEQVTKRICGAPSRRVATEGVKFLAKQVGDGDPRAIKLALESEQGTTFWTQVVRSLLAAAPRTPLSRTLVVVGGQWLERNPNSDEWSKTWYPVLVASSNAIRHRSRLTEVTCEWLDSHEPNGRWFWIVEQLRRYAPSVNSRYMKKWLCERAEDRRWPMRFRAACKENPNDKELRKIGIEWLSTHIGRSDWRWLLASLWREPPDTELLDLCWLHLIHQTNARRLPVTWRTLVARPPASPTVRREAELLLETSDNFWAWSHVFIALLPESQRRELRDAGRAWLERHFDQKGWPFVFKAIVRGSPEDWQIEIGRLWLCKGPSKQTAFIVRNALSDLEKKRGHLGVAHLSSPSSNVEKR